MACFADGALNVDPNRSTTADPALLFTAAEVKFSLLRVAELTWPVALMNQQWASGGRWGLEQARYDQTRIRSAWGSIYTDVLKNLVLAARDAETRTPKPNNSIAQLKIYTAFVFSQTSYLWGDIPFCVGGKADGDSGWHLNLALSFGLGLPPIDSPAPTKRRGVIR